MLLCLAFLDGWTVYLVYFLSQSYLAQRDSTSTLEEDLTFLMLVSLLPITPLILTVVLYLPWLNPLLVGLYYIVYLGVLVSLISIKEEKILARGDAVVGVVLLMLGISGLVYLV